MSIKQNFKTQNEDKDRVGAEEKAITNLSIVE